MLRKPAVAGQFYPAHADQLTEMIRGFLDPLGQPAAAIGAVIPHAGYVYSGHVAGAVYSRVQIPQRLILLCPNHTGYGVPLSIMATGQWQTPLGVLQIDEELSEALIASDASLQDDVMAHRFEHALEVQLPFLQHLAGSEVRFVPITVGTGSWTQIEALGIAMAEVVAAVDRNILIIASSDMNHYESDGMTRIKDRKAIDCILRLDAGALHKTVRDEKISMCGAGPATAMLIAANRLGASKAELVKSATSGDVSKDFDHVVGYAGLIVS